MKVYYDKEAIEKVKSGSNKLCRAVAVTLGPKGRNVLIAKKDEDYRAIVNDGITIARKFKLDDYFEDSVAKNILEAAHRTNREAGDGTTTTIILTNAFLEAGFKEIIGSWFKAGKSPMEVRQLLEKYSQDIIKDLGQYVKPVTTVEDLAKIGFISSESKEIGDLIAQLLFDLGKDAIVDIEESEKPGITKEIKTGFDFEGVMVSASLPREISDNVPVLVVDYKLRSVTALQKLFQKLLAQGENRLAILCDDIDTEALSFLAYNNLKGTFKTLVIKAESFTKFEHMEDVAALCGTTVLSRDSGVELGDIEITQLGVADKITLPTIQDAVAKTTIIRRGANLEKHIEYLHSKIESAFDKERLNRRIAKLNGGVSAILVGAPTPSERMYLKLKIEDAVNSVRSAMEEGVIDGGGIALYRISDKYGFLRDALKTPYKTIFANSGKKLVYKPFGAYDARGDKWVDKPFESGIIDSYKVVRNAVKNAASSAGILLTTSVAMIES